MNDLKARFSSRKFLMSLSGAIACVAAGEWTALSGIIIGYCASEGLIDAVTAKKAGDVAEAIIPAANPKKGILH